MEDEELHDGVGAGHGAEADVLGGADGAARDIPGLGLGAEQGPGGEEGKRKGRYSVEEYVSGAVCEVLKASSCRMHPCGREDMDVRMLGMSGSGSGSGLRLESRGYPLQFDCICFLPL